MTEGVQRAAGDLVGSSADGTAQALGNLVSRLVGEGDRANPSRWHVLFLDEVPDALDQAEGLARAGPGHDEHGSQGGLDGAALSCRGRGRRIRVGGSPYPGHGDARMYAANEGTARQERAPWALPSTRPRTMYGAAARA